MSTWHKLHIADRTGKEWFKTMASPMSTASEIKNLKQHIERMKAQPFLYNFLDPITARIYLDGVVYSDVEITDDELLNLLFD